MVVDVWTCPAQQLGNLFAHHLTFSSWAPQLEPTSPIGLAFLPFGPQTYIMQAMRRFARQNATSASTCFQKTPCSRPSVYFPDVSSEYSTKRCRIYELSQVPLSVSDIEHYTWNLDINTLDSLDLGPIVSISSVDPVEVSAFARFAGRPPKTGNPWHCW